MRGDFQTFYFFWNFSKTYILWYFRYCFCCVLNSPMFLNLFNSHNLKTSSDKWSEIIKSPLSSIDMKPLSKSLSKFGANNRPLFPSSLSWLLEFFQGLIWLAIKYVESVTPVNLHFLSTLLRFSLYLPWPFRASTNAFLDVDWRLLSAYISLTIVSSSIESINSLLSITLYLSFLPKGKLFLSFFFHLRQMSPYKKLHQ